MGDVWSCVLRDKEFLAISGKQGSSTMPPSTESPLPSNTKCDEVDWLSGLDDMIDGRQRGLEIGNEVVRLVGLRLDGPAWRWQTATRLAERRRARRGTDYGPVVWHAVHHLCGVRSELRAELLGDRKIQVRQAVEIHRNDSRRWAVEARLLAGESVDAVAAAAVVPSSLVHDYCDLFFDVLDRLQAKRWIVAKILDPAVTSPVQRSLYRHAYFGGRHVCQRWLRLLGRLEDPVDLSTASGRDVERMRLAILAETVAEEDPQQMVKLMPKFRAKQNAGAQDRSTVSELITARVARRLRSCVDAVDPTVAAVRPTSGSADRQLASAKRA